jgi:hypothetical protein
LLAILAALLLATPGIAASDEAQPQAPAAGDVDKLPIAAVVSEYRTNSHADMIVGRVIETASLDGKGRAYPLEIVSMYTDQVPENDTSRALAAKHQFKIALLDDVSVRIHPLTDHDVDEMLTGLRGFPLLTGYRGSDPVDLDAVKRLLFRLSSLAEHVPQIRELDLNPVFAGPGGVTAVDARIRLARRGDSASDVVGLRADR